MNLALALLTLFFTLGITVGSFTVYAITHGRLDRERRRNRERIIRMRNDLRDEYAAWALEAARRQYALGYYAGQGMTENKDISRSHITHGYGAN